MKHIYIIENNIGLLDALTFLLEKKYLLSPMSDARIALNKLQSEQPDLILLDLLMPNFNGVEFIKAFSLQNQKTPILVMTACSNVDVLVKCSVAGIIHKPFQIDEIEKKIEQVLAN